MLREGGVDEDRGRIRLVGVADEHAELAALDGGGEAAVLAQGAAQFVVGERELGRAFRTRASSCSCACWSASSARLRSVMSRTSASMSRWPPLRKMPTRASIGKGRAVLAPVDARGRHGHAGHHLLPAFAALHGVEGDVDVR